jgi:formylglycine-generating enzyme required for sulfatase activity
MKNTRECNYVSLILTTVAMMLLIRATALGQGAGRETTKPTPKPSVSKPSPPSHKRTTCSSQSRADASGRTRVVDLNGVKLELVEIPPGTFCMGSNKAPEETPFHQVRIKKSFYIGKYEVTQAQWRVLMGNNPSHFQECSNCPVERVTWYDAQNFIQKLNRMNDGYTYRLPTEAEWEYACPAGTTTEVSFGDSLSSDQANFDGNNPYGGAAKGIEKGPAPWEAFVQMIGAYTTCMATFTSGARIGITKLTTVHPRTAVRG